MTRHLKEKLMLKNKNETIMEGLQKKIQTVDNWGDDDDSGWDYDNGWDNDVNWSDNFFKGLLNVHPGCTANSYTPGVYDNKYTRGCKIISVHLGV
jgi:hypothetical protein